MLTLATLCVYLFPSPPCKKKHTHSDFFYRTFHGCSTLARMPPRRKKRIHACYGLQKGVLLRRTIANRTQILLVKIYEYIGSCVHRRSYLLGSPVILLYGLQKGVLLLYGLQRSTTTIEGWRRRGGKGHRISGDGRELVSKPAISLKKSWGEATVERLNNNTFIPASVKNGSPPARASVAVECAP